MGDVARPAASVQRVLSRHAVSSLCWLTLTGCAAGPASERYRALLDEVEAAAELNDELIGRALTAMSSGERLWYRHGAWVCNHIEQEHGREFLISTIDANDRKTD